MNSLAAFLLVVVALLASGCKSEELTRSKAEEMINSAWATDQFDVRFDSETVIEWRLTCGNCNASVSVRLVILSSTIS